MLLCWGCWFARAADAIPTQSPAPVVQFFATDRRMALVAVPSVADAVIALVRLHDTQMGDRRLRVSFSNKDPATLKNSDESPAAAAAAASSSAQASPAAMAE